MKAMNRILSIAILTATTIVPSLTGSLRAADKPQANPRKIFVVGTNEAPAWMVRVDVDKTERLYVPGENIKVKVLSEEDGYLYLFNVGPDGSIDCLFPNGFQPDNKITGKQEVVVGDKFKMGIKAPFGTDLIKAIVTKKPLKSVKAEDLIDKDKSPRTVDEATARRIMVEALTGDPDLAKGDKPIDKIRNDFKEKNGDEYKNRLKEFAEHQVEVITAAKKPDKVAEKRVGLFIGVSDFQDNSIRKLATADKDASKMAEVMRKDCQFETTYLLTNKEATLSNIRTHMVEKLVQDTRPGDTVVIYWSGHGGRCANTDGSSKDGFDEFLVPYDGSLDSNAAVHKSMLLDKTMGRWVQELDGRKVMVILDTCHSGGFGGAAKGLHANEESFVKGLGVADKTKNKWGDIGLEKWSADSNPFFLAPQMSRAKSIGQKDAAVLASSTAKQVSFERKDKELSVMTYCIVNFVKNNRRTLTLKDVFEGVKKDVSDYVQKNFEGTDQTPVFSDQLVEAPAKVRP